MDKEAYTITRERLDQIVGEVTAELRKFSADAIGEGSEGSSSGSSDSAPVPPAAEGDSPVPGEAQQALPGESASDAMHGESSGSDSSSGSSGEIPGMPDESSSSSSSSSSGSSSSGSSDDGMDAGPTHEELAQAYCELPDDQLRAHYMAVKEAMFQRMGDGQPAPQMPGAMPPAQAPAPDMGMGKAETPAGGTLENVAPTKTTSAGPDRLESVAPGKAGAGQDRLAAVAPTRKSEDEIGDLKKSLNEALAAIEKKVDAEIGALAVSVKAAMSSAAERKAVTAISQIESPLTKAEVDVDSLSHREIMARLTEKSRQKLSKSDAELVQKFCVNAATPQQIAHLIKE